jgi:large subunit ribosomal protein L24
MKLKKNDNVIVITGRDKGKKGKITRVIVADNKVVIEGINMMKKHQRARTKEGKGQMVNTAMPIHVSNIRKAE